MRIGRPLWRRPDACGRRWFGWAWTPAGPDTTFAPEARDAGGLAEVALTQVGTDADWGRVSASAYHACAIKTDGRLFCWGLNNVYQLGDDTNVERTSPIAVAPALRWVDVSAGGGVTCGVTTTGELRCSGAYLGGGHTPKMIGTSTDWARVSVDLQNGNVACAVSRTGALFCWGLSTARALGLGAVTSAPLPTRVGTDSDWIDVAVGNGFSCGTRSDLARITSGRRATRSRPFHAT